MKINIRSLFRKSSNAQEAIERRDSAKWLALGCLAVAILLTIIGNIIKVTFLETIGYFVIFAAVGFFVLWYFVRGDVHRLQNIFCECGEKFRFPDNVTYEIKGEQISSGRSSDGNGTTSHTSTTVTLLCKCKCGKEHTFDSVFVTAKKEMNQKGVVIRTKEYPLEEQLVSFFNK